MRGSAGGEPLDEERGQSDGDAESGTQRHESEISKSRRSSAGGDDLERADDVVHGLASAGPVLNHRDHQARIELANPDRLREAKEVLSSFGWKHRAVEACGDSSGQHQMRRSDLFERGGVEMARARGESILERDSPTRFSELPRCSNPRILRRERRNEREIRMRRRHGLIRVLNRSELEGHPRYDRRG